MNWIKETVLPKFKAFVKIKEPEEVLWIKCKSCSQMIFHKEFTSNQNVCKTCGFHDHLSAKERIEFLLDKDTIENITIPIPKLDPLNFKDKKKILMLFLSGLLISTFWLSVLSQNSILTFINTLTAFFGPIFAIIIADFYNVKKEKINDLLRKKNSKNSQN